MYAMGVYILVVEDSLYTVQGFQLVRKDCKHSYVMFFMFCLLGEC